MDKTADQYSRSGNIHQLPPGFDFRALAKTFMQIVQKRHISVAEILGTVRAQGFGSDEVALTAVIQQMSLMIPHVDAHRVFYSEAHKADVQKAFLECLTEQYTKFTPEEEPFFSQDQQFEELVPEGLEQDLAAFKEDEEKLRLTQKDSEELAAFMREYDGLINQEK